jgi:hypothetical protein
MKRRRAAQSRARSRRRQAGEVREGEEGPLATPGAVQGEAQGSLVRHSKDFYLD